MPDDTIREACTSLTAALAQLLLAIRDAREGENFRTASEPVGEMVAIHERKPPIDQHVDAKAGQQRIFIYMAGAKGLATLARTHGRAIMRSLGLSGEHYVVKCGTSTVPLEMRLQQIGRDRYGASIVEGKDVIVEPGFERWIMHAITTSRPSTDASITLSPRAIVVDLPPTMTRRQFDKALQDGLRKRALADLPTTVMPKRYSAYDLGTTRLSEAHELYALSPLRPADGDFLLAVVENIIRRCRSKPAALPVPPLAVDMSAKPVSRAMSLKALTFAPKRRMRRA